MDIFVTNGWIMRFLYQKKKTNNNDIFETCETLQNDETSRDDNLSLWR